MPNHTRPFIIIFKKCVSFFLRNMLLYAQKKKEMKKQCVSKGKQDVKFLKLIVKVEVTEVTSK